MRLKFGVLGCADEPSGFASSKHGRASYSKVMTIPYPSLHPVLSDLPPLPRLPAAGSQKVNKAKLWNLRVRLVVRFRTPRGQLSRSLTLTRAHGAGGARSADTCEHGNASVGFNGICAQPMLQRPPWSERSTLVSHSDRVGKQIRRHRILHQGQDVEPNAMETGWTHFRSAREPTQPRSPSARARTLGSRGSTPSCLARA